MVSGDTPVTLLTKAPVPEPSVVLLFAIVGLVVVLQQTPRTSTAKLPSKEILPPLPHEVEEIAETDVVDKTGISPITQRTDIPPLLE